MDPFTTSALISGGSSILGGLLGGSSAKKAAKAQEAAARAAQEEVQRQYDTTREDLAPWRTAGTNALDRLEFLLGIGGRGSTNPAVGQARNALQQAEAEYQALLGGQSSSPAQMPPIYSGKEGGEEWWAGQQKPSQGVDSSALSAARARVEQARNALTAAQGQPYDVPAGYGSLLKPFGLDDFEADPGYAFRQAEGLKGVENSAAAKGMQLSGANIKGLMRYNSGLASQEYGNAFARDASNKDRSYNYLSGVSNAGLNASAQTGAFGAQAAGTTADMMTQAGNAQAAGIVGQSQAFSNAAQGVGDAMNYYNMMRMLRGG